VRTEKSAASSGSTALGPPAPRMSAEGRSWMIPAQSRAGGAANERVGNIRRGLTRVRKEPHQGMGRLSREGRDNHGTGRCPGVDAVPRRDVAARLGQARRLRRVACFIDAAPSVRGFSPEDLRCCVRPLVRGPSGRERPSVPGHPTRSSACCGLSSRVRPWGSPATLGGSNWNAGRNVVVWSSAV
jgi:hypothetical protein